MKAKSATEAKKLEDIPNIGRALANDLREIGALKPSQLKGKDGIALYKNLNKKTGTRHDPCVADAFMAAIHFMNGNKPVPWWKFTAERKAKL